MGLYSIKVFAIYASWVYDKDMANNKPQNNQADPPFAAAVTTRGGQQDRPDLRGALTPM